jgi:hypothetical protein
VGAGIAIEFLGCNKGRMSLQGPGEAEELLGGLVVKFEEWLFRSTVLKYTAINGLAIFIIEIESDLCANPECKDGLSGH